MKMTYGYRMMLYTAVCCTMVFFVIAGLSACKREKADVLVQQEVEAADINRIWNCHNAENKFPSQINANIEGAWVWQNVTCNGASPRTLSADKQVVVTFNDGGLYKVFESGKITSEGSWTLSRADADNWIITTSSPSVYLKGYVLLCKNELVLFSGYLDGCDYYFTRQ